MPSLILGSDSVASQESGLSLSGPAQYSLSLGSYLQGLADRITPSAANSIDEISRGVVNMTEAESSTEHTLHGHLLQMVALHNCDTSHYDSSSSGS